MIEQPQTHAHGSRIGGIRVCGFVVVLVGLAASFAAYRSGEAGPGRPAIATSVEQAAIGDDAPAAASVGPDIDPAHVMGVAAGDCKKCHEASVAHWQTTKHYNSEKTLFADNAKKYADALKIPEASIRKDSLCVKCHATTSSREGALAAVSGVSCESCHGASGGEDGWLNPHHVYGPNITRREQESPDHRKMRLAKVEAAGMIRPANLFKLARNCYQCHLVGDGELVAAGHKLESSAFEVTSWVNGEVKHNFFLDPTTNADGPSLWMANTGRSAQERKRLLFVAGILADLETSLRCRATAKNAAYSAQISGRIAAINGAKLGPLARIPEIAPLPGKVGLALGRLFAPMPDDAKFYNDMADEIAKVAEQFEANHDGSKLDFLDAMIPAPKPKS